MENTQASLKIMKDFTNKLSSLVDEETSKTLNLDDTDYNKGFKKASFEITGKLDKAISEVKNSLVEIPSKTTVN